MAKKRTRAANGMGTVRQRKDGLWEGRYTAPDGRQRSVYARTEGEVTKKLRAALHEVDTGAWREPSKMLMSDWLDIWLKDYQGHTSERTINKYKCIVEKHYKSMVGDVRVVKLLPLHVRRMITTMQEQGRAASTIQNYIGIFGAAMECAIEAGLIHDNPVTRVKLPRIPPKKFCIVDRAQIPAFFAAAKETPYENELRIMLLTGLRVGEVRGLKWEDVDLDSATMNVCRQMHPKNGNFKQFTPPKYGEARLLHLAPEAVETLQAQRRKQAEQRLAMGAYWIEDEISSGLVFRHKDGKPHSEHSIYRAVKDVGKALGMPELHPHDLRHSYAIAALRSGADVKTVQYNLGHRTASMTLDVYASYTDDAGKDGAEKLSEYLKNAEKRC